MDVAQVKRRGVLITLEFVYFMYYNLMAILIVAIKEKNGHKDGQQKIIYLTSGLFN